MLWVSFIRNTAIKSSLLQINATFFKDPYKRHSFKEGGGAIHVPPPSFYFQQGEGIPLTTISQEHGGYGATALPCARCTTHTGKRNEEGRRERRTGVLI